MTCPNCGSDLEINEIIDKYREVIKIDKCRNCGSFSLDRHELNRLDDDTVRDIDILVFKEHDPDHELDCPRCHIPMKMQVDHKHNDTKLQICGECGGIFLKKGALCQYHGVKHQEKLKKFDNVGIYSSRDHILTNIIAATIILFGGLIAYLKITNFEALSADEIVNSSNNNSSALLYIVLGGVIILFIFGILLSFTRSNRSVRLLGWSTILLSIALIFVLST